MQEPLVLRGLAGCFVDQAQELGLTLAAGWKPALFWQPLHTRY